MTTQKEEETCPAQTILKLVSGKWKPEIFRLATKSPIRFSSLLRELEGSNKQSLTVALRDMEASGLLEKNIVSDKPLHIEYTLTAFGKSFIPVFQQLEDLG